MQLELNIDISQCTAAQLTNNLAAWYEHQGMRKLTKTQFLDALERLGYKLDLTCCTNYHNTANKVPYLAKSIYIVQKDNGMSYCHFQARRDDNFKQLKEILNNSFVLHNNRIWEL